MADVKISALPLATTPLAGTEVLPIVQSATTDQVTVANLTAGRAVSASSLTLTTTPLAVGSGGTGLNTLTAGYIPFGAGTSAFGSSSNLFWDSANARLGIQNLSPAAPLDVGGNIVGAALGAGTVPTYTIHAKKNAASVYITAENQSATGIAGLILYCSNASLTNAYGLFEYAYTGEFNLNNAFATGVHKFSIAGSEKMRITSTGAVGIGTSTPNVKLELLQLSPASGVNEMLRLTNSYNPSNPANEPAIRFDNGAGTSYWTIGAAVAGSDYLRFLRNGLEQMRITSTGDVSIGDTASPAKLYVLQSVDTVGFRVYNNNASFTSEAFQVIALRAATSAYTLAAFYSDGGGTYAVRIRGDGSVYSATLTGGATTLSVDASGYIIRTPSDRSLKINDVEVPYGLSTVQKMRPVIHEWTTEANMGEGKSIGFIAQEMEKIVPEVISGGNTKSLDYGKLTPVLVKAIQELAAKVTELEAKI